MRLLWVVPYTPNRIHVRSYELLRALAARGHMITLVTLVAEPTEWEEEEALRGLGIEVIAEPLSRSRTLWNALRTLPTREPLQARWADVPTLRRRILEKLLSTPFDAIHVEHLRGAPYALLAHKQRMAAPGARPPTLVWDSVDSISLLFAQTAESSVNRKMRWMARLELDRTRRMEGRLARTFDHTVVVAAADAAEFQRLAAAHVPVTIVPNGVDFEHFHPPAVERRAAARIVLSGKMSYHANVTAATNLVREIMPRVWAQRPDAELWIAGKEPSAEVRTLAGERVVVTGSVPSMAAVLQEATVAAASIAYGVGIQNKVLEAMACATPVVATAQAASALQAVAGQDYLRASTQDEFAQALLALLADPALRAHIGAAGRAYVERYHSWHASAALLEELYAAPSP